MKVLTDNKYYSQIADVIREQNGTSNTYKPQQMVRALKDLFYEEVEGVLPITFQGIGENLLDYRIDGASGGVGDRTKNLLQNTATSQTINGVTFTVNNDKSITCNGRAAGTAAITINTIFSINSTKISGCPMGGSWSSFELDLLNINTNNVDVMDTGNGAVIQSENSYRVRIRIASGYTCNNLTFYPMIRKADIEDDTYEPYGYKVPVVLSGKNLLPRIATSQTINGVTFTVNDDGSVTCNGTAEQITQYVFSDNTIYENCVLSGCPSGGGYNNYLLRFRGTNGEQISETGSGKPISNAEGYVEIRLNTGYTCDNLTFYPMIRLAAIEDDTYEPYHEPTTTNIYLDEPIGENESISLSDTNTNILTIRGTNILTVDTTVQPDKVYVKSRHESSYEKAMREKYEEAKAELEEYKSQEETQSTNSTNSVQEVQALRMNNVIEENTEESEEV